MSYLPNKKGMAKGRMTLNYRGDSKETNFARRKKVCMPCILPDDWKLGTSTVSSPILCARCNNPTTAIAVVQPR